MIMDNLLAELKNATNVAVKPGWITSEKPPLITVLQTGGRGVSVGNTSHMLREHEFQIDVWALSAKQRDEIADKIVKHFVSNWQPKYLSYGWYGARVYGIRDIDEEGFYRKTLVLVLLVWVVP